MLSETHLTHYMDGRISFREAVAAGGVVYALGEAVKYAHPKLAVGPYTRAFLAGLLDAALDAAQGV